MSGDSAPDDPSIGAATDRWLRKRQTGSTDRILRGYRSRMDQFITWSDEQGIETVAELDAWELDE